MTIDRLISEFDKALRTIFASAPKGREMPGALLPEVEIDQFERRHAAALMRINHCGEICAQALYQGQSLTSDNIDTKNALAYAAQEETEHLNWTEQRLQELGSHKSFLNPVWYAGSLAMGLAAGKFGDGWNLGFLAETERQVERHLESHLHNLPQQDIRSREIVAQMKTDESGHADIAMKLGAKELPEPVKKTMRMVSRVMTSIAYYI